MCILRAHTHTHYVRSSFHRNVSGTEENLTLEATKINYCSCETSRDLSILLHLNFISFEFDGVNGREKNVWRNVLQPSTSIRIDDEHTFTTLGSIRIDPCT